ncbi:hypothetical protein HYZ97_03530 [Candidatus Pacearchaeota archaeon]|nr:hypothetical protein [Candidatus Pacearchaeota archaeon]
MKKALIFDSGTLINLSMNGLLYILPALKQRLKGVFLITEAVKREIIDRPMHVLRFELGALRLQQLLDSRILEMPASLGIQEQTLQEETNLLLDKANHYLQVDGRWITIVSEAEISCLALSDECARLNIENLIAIDERTTRLLAEKPENLEQLMSKRLNQHVKLIAQDYSIFAKYRFIRSSELVYVAYKKNLLQLQGKKALEAALYATKFHGAAISFEEIEQLKKL